MTEAVLYIRSTLSNPPAKQRQMVQRYLDGKDIHIIAEEVERAGAMKRKSFPAFKRALEVADGRLIVISNLGQAGTSHVFLKILRGCGDFIALNQSSCCPRTLETLIAAAEDGAANKSVELKATFACLKKKGVQLGSSIPGATAGAEALRRYAGKGPKIASRLRIQQARNFYQDVMPRIVELHSQSYTHEEIANELNDADYIMQSGGLFHQVAVLRLVKRWEKENGDINKGSDRPRPGPRVVSVEFPFAFGPYKPPIKIGNKVKDYVTRKRISVVDTWNGWPLQSNGDLVLMGGLVLAVCGESTNAIRQHWKVSSDKVRSWKEAIAGQTRDIKPILESKRKDPAFRKQVKTCC